MVPRNEIAGIDIDDDGKPLCVSLIMHHIIELCCIKGSLDEQVLGILRVREAVSFVIRKNEFTKETLLTCRR